MSRKKKPRMEYRYYEVPEKCPVLVLQGEKWLQNYGYQIDYLHQKRSGQSFHFLEIKFPFFTHAFNDQFDHLRDLRPFLIFHKMGLLVNTRNQLLCHAHIALIQLCNKSFHIHKHPCPGTYTVFF